jgi:hypothetical protein
MILMLGLVSFNVFAVGCDCEVRVYSPMTGSHQRPFDTIQKYQLEEYNSYSFKSQNACKKSCIQKVQAEMTTDKVHAFLLTHTQNLINEKALGFNCTGLTTVKYPVRVKVSLGSLGLGNISDRVEVINHEEVCF